MRVTTASVLASTDPTRIGYWTAAVANVVDDFLPGRAEIVLAQLAEDGLYPERGAPVFSQHGGDVPMRHKLAIKNPDRSGTIYFTIDGSDPRAVGGGIRPGTKQGKRDATLELASTATVSASATRWSGS